MALAADEMDASSMLFFFDPRRRSCFEGHVQEPYVSDTSKSGAGGRGQHALMTSACGSCTWASGLKSM